MNHNDPLAMLLSGDASWSEDVSGEDPFVGAALTMMKPQPSAINISSLLQGRQPVDISQLRNVMNTLQAAQKVAQAEDSASRRQRIETLSKTDNLPVTFLGVDSVVVAPAGIPAGAGAAVPFAPVSPVRITNFTVATAIAPLFVINSIQIGRTNLLMNGTAVPADRFTPDSTRPPFEAPILPASVQGIINVTNISGAPARFLGSFDVIDLGRRHPDCNL